jgi:hypothetical protein
MSGPTYVRIGADVVELTQKKAVAKAELQDLEQQLRSLAAQMNAAGATANAELKAGLLTIATDTARARAEVALLNKEMRESNASSFSSFRNGIRESLEPLENLTRLTMAFAPALEVAFLGREMLESIEKMADLGAQLEKLHQQTGVAVETLSGLHYAAEQEEVSAESLDTAIKRLGKSIQESLKEPSGNAASAFHAMGISQDFLREHSNDLLTILLKMADAFHDHADGAQADAIAMATLGRGGVEMIPVLRQGSEEIGRQIEKQKELGNQITGPMAVAMKQHGDALKDMKESWHGMWLEWDNNVIPGLTKLYEGLTKSFQVMKAFPSLLAAGSKLNSGRLSGGETAGPGQGNMVDAPVPTARPEPPKAEFGNIGKPKEKSDRASKDFTAQWKYELDQQLIAQQMFGQQAEAFELQFWQQKLVIAQAGGKDYASTVRQITSTIYQLESQQNRQQLEDQRRAEAEKKRAVDEGYRNFRAAIEAEREAASGNIAEQLRLDQELVDRARQLYGQDAANFQDALRRKTADMRQQVEQQMQPYRRLVSTIGNSFDQMFQGLLQGQMSFRQAMARLTLSLIADFGRMAIRSVEEWALAKLKEVLITEQTEAAKTAATAAGAASQTAVHTAAAAEGKAAQAVAGSASVFADANKAAAGAYAAVAGIPYVGPILAPIAAATAFGAVLAFDVFSAEGGMDIGSGVNPMTQLHEKEMVLPAHLAEGVRNMTDSGGAGGGDVVQFHYHPPEGGKGNHREHARDMVDEFNHAVRIGKIKLKRA